MKTLILLMMLAAAVLWPVRSTAQVSRGCPLATPSDQGRVRNLLLVPPTEILARFGLDSADVQTLRPLSGPEDGTVCEEIWAAIERGRAGGIGPMAKLSFFQSGPLYFVAYKGNKPRTRIIIDEGDGMVYLLGWDFNLRYRFRG
jgi:hypothetical protein